MIKKRDVMGEDKYLRGKYEAIYGKGNYEDKIKRLHKKLKVRYVFIISLFIFAITFSFVSNKDAGSLIKFSNNGNIISIIRPENGQGGEIINTKVWLISENGKVAKSKDILVEEISENKNGNEDILYEESQEEVIERKLNGSIRSINENTKAKEVVLPKKLEDGTRLVWQEEKKNNYVILIIGCFLFLIIIFRGRYDEIKREEYMARESIIRELPGFINRLVLILGAGIVVNAAFTRILKEEKSMGEENSYFYNQLKKMEEKARETNSSVHVELANFAKRSGVHELMRFSNIVTDNVYKGGELINKLTQESNVLWFARKKHSEEKGRMAETKLTIPLVILLMVLIMITIAPAMLQI